MRVMSLNYENLISLLKPYDNWFNDQGEEKNIQAKEALFLFYKLLQEYIPSKTYKKKDGNHMSYLRHLIAIKKALLEEKYMRACNELLSLIHYDYILQGRIYFNIINLLEDKFKQQGLMS